MDNGVNFTIPKHNSIDDVINKLDTIIYLFKEFALAVDDEFKTLRQEIKNGTERN